MAHAIVSGALSSRFLAAGDILVSEPDLVRRDGYIKLGVRVTQENAETAACDFLLLAVKPQVFVEAVASLRHADRLPVVISIMAGKTRRAIRQSLPSAKIARVMPNLPCAVGAGMAGMDTSELSGEERGFVEGLFRSVGQTAEVEEALLDAVTGISGSGPAYVYLFLRALIRAGVAHGLTEERAKQLALQTIAGGVERARRSERSPDEAPQEAEDASAPAPEAPKEEAAAADGAAAPAETSAAPAETSAAPEQEETALTADAEAIEKSNQEET